MTKQEIDRIIARFTLKPGYEIFFNTDQYGSVQFILRKDGALAYRYWSYETDAAYNIERAMEYAGTRKTDAEIAAHEAAVRATELRRDALFFMEHGLDSQVLLSDFTREELEAEIAIVESEYAVRMASDMLNTARAVAEEEGNPAPLAVELTGNGCIVSIYYENGHDVFPFRFPNEAKAMAVFNALEALMYPSGDAVNMVCQVVTKGGLTLRAAASKITTSEQGVLSAEWDMRHALIHNPRYSYQVRPDDVKSIHFERA